MSLTIEPSPAKSIATSSTHLNYLDGIRAVAAIWVMVSHIIQPITTHVSPFLVNIFGDSHLAVTIFIVISGYCLILPVLKEGKIKGGSAGFFIRRWRRILPPYYASLALAIWVDGYVGRFTPFNGYVRSIHDHLLLMQDFSNAPVNVNTPSWSVAVEWHIYLFFPLFVFLMARLGTVKTVIYACLLSFLLLQFWADAPVGIQYYGLFTLGMAAASFSQDAEILSKQIYKIPILALFLGSWTLFAGYVLWIGQAQYNQNCLYLDFPAALIAAMGLIVIRYQKHLNALFSMRPLVAIGKFSYSLYLTHWPVYLYIASVTTIPHFGLNVYCERSVYIAAVCILFAFVFYQICERPFLSRSKSIFRRNVRSQPTLVS